MLEAATGALIQLFTPYYLLLFAVGILLGLVLGLVPGMGGSVAMALVLPFAMKLDAAAALPLVMGLISPILTSDSIPAILIGTPGAACAATVMDGYPMAQKGQAGRALGIAFTASAIGGVFGAFLLAVSIPVVRPLVLLLETPEFLALSILAISSVSVLSGGRVLKGIAAAGLGLLLSMVGADPIRFVVRWGLGVPFLIEGIPVIPVALGLFAIPEILELCARGTPVARVTAGSMQGRRRGVTDTLRRWKLVLSSSGIAALVGVLPGLGSTVSTWLCYSWAVVISRDKARFGKGEVRGVIAAEAANNASASASLIPTIAFGVPGSTVTALVLVVFWAVGITPGPKLLTEHVDMVFLIVWSVALANILGSLVCYLLTNKLAMITLIPPHVLAPLALTTVFTSTLYSTADVGGVVTLLGFGVLGWLMKSLEWPRAALLLAFILGPLIEKFYFQTTMMHGSAWLMRPGVVVILGGAVGIICLGASIQRRVAAAGPR